MSLYRRLRLVALCVSLVALVLSVWAAISSFERLNQVRQQATNVRLQLGQLRNLLPAIEQREAYARGAQSIATQLVEAVPDASLWSQRRVQRTASLVSRYEAENDISQLSANESLHWFVPESFSVSILSPQGGLFTPAAADDKGFNLEYSGLIYFPVEPQ